MTKYIFVTGGVVSGLGKGITAASLGMMLKAKGLKVIAQKLDPYINLAPSMMSPLQHGEVFVTEDGAETDLDLGHYERFIDENLNAYSSLTSGKIYHSVLENERNGLYRGDTIQVIPHVTNEIKKVIYTAGKTAAADVVIAEIGGTTGDIESLPHIEAIRQISNEVGRENCLFIHVTLAPVMRESGEMKSKPTQHSVKELRSLGIAPDVIILRCDRPIDQSTREKISMFCNVQPDCVIDNLDAELLYEVPLLLERVNFTKIVSRELGLPQTPPDTAAWEKMLAKARARKSTVKITLVGKYVKLHDAYLSVVEALTHAGIENGVKISVNWLDSKTLSDSTAKVLLSDAHGVIVPYGFGDGGIEGMMAAAKYCRENHVPYFGIQLGAQTAVIEFARNMAGLTDADSREFNPGCAHKVIETGVMRLGASPTRVQKNTLLHKAYKSTEISERHRNRCDINCGYIPQLEAAGLRFSAFDTVSNVAEAFELPQHEFFVGVQFFPEFKSRPHKPHPLYVKFVCAALNRKNG
ncbi:MAG: CTP synthase [Firmicutes bacterium]|nr:CTP synthase [Bacillota bacterium]